MHRLFLDYNTLMALQTASKACGFSCCIESKFEMAHVPHITLSVGYKPADIVQEIYGR